MNTGTNEISAEVSTATAENSRFLRDVLNGLMGKHKKFIRNSFSACVLLARARFSV
jgi:hypothetical protein